MTSEQCRAARAALDWSMDDLAKAAKVSQSTIRDFEAKRRTPIPNNLEAIIKALEAKGIRFWKKDGSVGIKWTDSPESA